MAVRHGETTRVDARPWSVLMLFMGLGLGAPACDCGGTPKANPDGSSVDATGPRADAASADSASADSGTVTPDTGTPDSGPPGVVRINEVVPYPVNDWSQSTGGGQPYQLPPGTGVISSLDEYIELYNEGPGVANLSGWQLEITGSEIAAVTVLGVDGVLVASPGSSLQTLQPGGFVVIGNPDASLTTDAYVVLRDSGGEVVDDVEIGGISESRDREGDGAGDGAPSRDQNGFARGSFEEAIARPVGLPDTDDDQADFVKMNATPLAPNTPLEPPVEVTLPQVVSTASGQDFPVTELLWIEFDEPMDALSFDGNIEARTSSGDIPLGFLTFEEKDRILHINPIGKLPFDRDITVTVRAGVTDLAGNALGSDYMFTVHTEAAPSNPAAILINEICASPVQDWDNTQGGDSAPFTVQPGNGEISSADEWIEFLVKVPGPINLSSYTLTLYNGPNIFSPAQSKSRFTSSLPTVRIIGTGTSINAVMQDDRVIMGNPIGAIRDDVYIALRDSSGRLVDAVELGGNTADSDRGGDGVDNGAPAAGASGASTGLVDETIARSPDGTDTGDDVADFAHATATLGAEN